MGTHGAWLTIWWSMPAHSAAAALGLWGWSARAWLTWASIRRLQNSAAFRLAGLLGRKE